MTAAAPAEYGTRRGHALRRRFQDFERSRAHQAGLLLFGVRKNALAGQDEGREDYLPIQSR
jgi:hypothetical protein